MQVARRLQLALPLLLDYINSTIFAGRTFLLNLFPESGIPPRPSESIDLGARSLLKLPIMKSMTCKQLGGACDKVFTAESFEEIAALSKQHGMEMFQAQDADHLKAMDAMRELMKSPEEMQSWMAARRAEFEAL